MRIVIDGNIGSGKTTQLNLIEEKGLKVKREPIEKWPLELFYSDKVRWGLTFQLVVLQTLTTEPGLVIYERSPMSSKQVFWELMKKTVVEDQVYKYFYDTVGWGPDVYILIDKSPETCFNHIQTRCQAGDSSVSLDYLKLLDEKYQKMFDSITCPKFRINGEDSVENIHENVFRIINDYVSVEKL
jgi:deoxyadenosine/deoxycytidine kinase